MTSRFPRISESEWVVADVLWEAPGLTAVEVAQRLPAEVAWKQKTVNTFLARLTEKGVLRAERQGKANCYFPLIARESCVKAAPFLQRLLGRSPAPLLAHFCETTPLSAEEIAQLRTILDVREAEVKAEAEGNPTPTDDDRHP